MESDDEIRKVPEMGSEAARPFNSGRYDGSVAGPEQVQASAELGQRKRGRNPADKENRRLKRYVGFRSRSSFHGQIPAHF